MTDKKNTPASVPAPATPKPENCGCGCGAPCVTAKARFLSGHDARHAGNIGRALAADANDADAKKAFDALTPALQAKVRSVQTTAVKKAALKKARAVANQAAKDAKAAALADALKAAGL